MQKIKEYFPDKSSKNFKLTQASQDEVKKEVLHLNVRRLSTSSSIPATRLKQLTENFLPLLINSINYPIRNG